MVILDSFISLAQQYAIEKTFLSPNPPYYFCNSTVTEEDYETSARTFNYKQIDSPQLVHSLVSNYKVCSEYFNLFLPVLGKMSGYIDPGYYLCRAKVNLNFATTGSDTDSFFPAHIDYKGAEKAKVLIYYITDSDGDTIFLQDENIVSHITPKRGTVVVFDNETFHAGQPPLTSKVRCLANFVFVDRRGIKIQSNI